jgi:hypothetical protein
MKPFRLYISSHAKERLFERRGVLITHEEEQAITETLAQERLQWPEGIDKAYITIGLNGINCEVILIKAKNTVNSDVWNLVTIMTGKRSSRVKPPRVGNKPAFIQKKFERDWRRKLARM